MSKIALNIIVWKENKYFVAECLNNHVSSFGKTKDEALKNINEALQLYFEDEATPNFVKIEQPELLESSFAYA